MKVGSIVECIDNAGMLLNIPPKLKTPYVVRGILEWRGKTGIYLEEIINKEHPHFPGIEVAYAIELFRELLPPMEIQSALDECEPVLIEL